MSSPSTKLFGTDGVRGVANLAPVTPEVALRLGRAAAHLLRKPGSAKRPVIVIGRDTRASGEMLESAFAAGAMSMGADTLSAGILPTPAVALLTPQLGAAAGVVLSASHNPFEDNGIKFFQHDGYKLNDALEREMEHLVASDAIDSLRPTGGEIGRASTLPDGVSRYVESVRKSFPEHVSLKGMKVILDCANGASAQTSPAALSALGAELTVIHHQPDGCNINENCGSTHPEDICRIVRETGAHVGIAHDGDADRVLLCDENGELVDGDELLAIAGLHALEKGKLARNTLVATVMSNFGLDETLRARGGHVLRTAVGDRYVIEAMVRDHLNIGGEQSGHMIFRDFNTTGDGLLSALQILAIVAETGKPLSELKRCLLKYPQAQRNLRVQRKPPLGELPEVSRRVSEAERALSGHGRVLLRYSGTEPKVRLLLEGRDAGQIEALADGIAEALQKSIGA